LYTVLQRLGEAIPVQFTTEVGANARRTWKEGKIRMSFSTDHAPLQDILKAPVETIPGAPQDRKLEPF
jgi:hypothetical protein